MNILSLGITSMFCGPLEHHSILSTNRRIQAATNHNQFSMREYLMSESYDLISVYKISLYKICNMHKECANQWNVSAKSVAVPASSILPLTCVNLLYYEMFYEIVHWKYSRYKITEVSSGQEERELKLTTLTSNAAQCPYSRL